MGRWVRSKLGLAVLAAAWSQPGRAVRTRSGTAHRPVDVRGTPSVAPSGRSSGRRAPKRGGRRQRASAVFPRLRSNGSLTHIIATCATGNNQGERMQNTIALEEHFAILDTVQDSAAFCPPDLWPELKGRLLKATDRRLRQMDKHGVEMMVMSRNPPAIHAIPQPATALESAPRATHTPIPSTAAHPALSRS